MILALGLALAIPREEVLDRAARYATHVWTATEDNTDAVSCADDWESDYTPGTYTALPYDWGGWVTIEEFDQQLADGYGVGSHSWHGSLWCTTGVDCSGFVSQLWDSGHYSTSTFYKTAWDIGWDELQRGDALNDPGSHMVLYTHTSEGGWPVFYESTGSSGVRLNSTGGWAYVDGYQPIRYSGIEDGASTGTVDNPVEIAAFPYEDTRWTAGAASDAFDAYGCAPDTDESGPEVLYRFSAATAGTLQAVVSDASGVDVDVHVLAAADPDACLARDDTDVGLTVGPGEVWLALDTWVGDDQEYPGPYVLTVTFDGRLGEPEEEVEDPPPAEDTAAVDTGSAVPADEVPRAEVVPRRKDEAQGCGCGAGGDGAGVAAVGLAGLLVRRRATAR